LDGFYIVNLYPLLRGIIVIEKIGALSALGIFFVYNCGKKLAALWLQA
jgi:hypothetical protein